MMVNFAPCRDRGKTIAKLIDEGILFLVNQQTIDQKEI